MNRKKLRLASVILSIIFLLLLTACAAGDVKFSQESPAGFWYGLWHGIIAFVSLIIHIFNENVVVYEMNNTGGWYDFGFLLGVICVWGGGSHASCKSSAKKKRDKEWKDISEKVENKVMRKLKAWTEKDEGTESDQEWEEIGQKVEQKLKRRIREWAENGVCQDSCRIDHYYFLKLRLPNISC